MPENIWTEQNEIPKYKKLENFVERQQGYRKRLGIAPKLNWNPILQNDSIGETG